MTKRTLTVTHPSGEVSTRTTDADYSHAIVIARHRASAIDAAREALARKERALAVGALEEKHVRPARKELAALEAFDHHATFEVKSWHTTEAAARKACRSGEKIVTVD